MSDTVYFAQFSDCHLFADIEQLHCGANVFGNLVKVLTTINQDVDISFLVFTGDLTQDHTKTSYLRFVEAYQQAVTRNLPCYFVAGNHDDLALLEQTFSQLPFSATRTINLAHWQIQLASSKSDTPAGLWHENEQNRVVSKIDKSKQQILMMHHHCVDVGYFIDRHGLQNQETFYDFLVARPEIKAVFCGHVHNAISTSIPKANIPLYSCPATCLQFDKSADTVANAGIGIGYRKISLSADNYATQTFFIEA